ncbi:MAG TPA: hypothetical protein VFZ17_00535 [Acidimicrobiia bacterium]|nr:hypothetical protein [Acidimicrobiia bacterium]
MSEPEMPGRDPMASGSGPDRPSMGIALTNWLVGRATGLLEKRSSRRGFLVGSAMVGSAVAVSGCMVATQPGSPYNRITDCGPGSACTDGYTEFCCTINDGVNVCPPDSFAGGWWRADYSSFCNGTRYYIDCMQNCCGPATGYQQFCAGCVECRCGGDCNTRKVYCNYFRYGQCHQEIVASGPIACRVVTCVPPYTVAEWACSTALAVDNATAEHGSPCLTRLPDSTQLAPGAAAFESPTGTFTVLDRTSAGNAQARTFNGAIYLPPVDVIPAVNSAISTAVDATGAYVFARGFGNALHYNRYANGAWAGEAVLGGVPLTSDPVAVTAFGNVYVFARSENLAMWHGHLDAGVWSGWFPIQGAATSNLAVTANPAGLFVFARGTDGALWYRRLVNGAFGPWSSLGGVGISDPTAVSDGGSVYVFMRQAGRAIWVRRFNGASWTPWESLGGSVAGDPKAAMGTFGPIVYARADDGNIWANTNFLGTWGGFKPLPGTRTNVNPVPLQTTLGMLGFTTGADRALWWGHFNDQGWAGWFSLGGSFAPLTGV